MTSIMTNVAAMAALQTLRSIGTQLDGTQRQVSSGYRVETASDNAAYWSISTTMRSDGMALSAVSDALGLGAAKVDVAYSGLEATTDIVSEFRSKLVAAKEPGVDKGKIQTELEQLKAQLISIASSSSFNGVNWLQTDAPEDLVELATLPTSLVSSFVRSQDGSVSVGEIDVELADISLFNTGGGGALQKDIRSLGDIGGFRDENLSGHSGEGSIGWQMTAPITLSGSQAISFDILIDGTVLQTVTIDKTTIDTALGTTDGIVDNEPDYMRVLGQAFSDAGISALVEAYSNTVYSGFPVVSIATQEATGSNLSSITVSGISDTSGGNAGGLMDTLMWETPGTYANSRFIYTTDFQVYRNVEFSFSFSVDGNPEHIVTVDRDLIDSTLGTSDGWITSPGQLAQVLNAAVSGMGLVASVMNTDQVVFSVDPAVYPDMGARSSLTVKFLDDNVGPAPDFNIVDVDITNPATDIDHYISGVDMMLEKVIDSASTLGAVKSRIDMQSDFTQTLMDTIDKGVGRLVDADMDEASARLKALQTQEQLAIQALQIANTNVENSRLLLG